MDYRKFLINVQEILILKQNYQNAQKIYFLKEFMFEHEHFILQTLTILFLHDFVIALCRRILVYFGETFKRCKSHNRISKLQKFCLFFCNLWHFYFFKTFYSFCCRRIIGYLGETFKESKFITEFLKFFTKVFPKEFYFVSKHISK